MCRPPGKRGGAEGAMIVVVFYPAGRGGASQGRFGALLHLGIKYK